MHRWLSRSLALLVLASSAGGCSSSNVNGPTATTEAPTVTDVYSGTINPNGAATNVFLVLAAGNITATLTELTGEATVVGLELGTTADGVTCQHVLSNDSARKGTQMIGRSSGGPAAFCARVYDTRHLTESVDYTLVVVHP